MSPTITTQTSQTTW